MKTSKIWHTIKSLFFAVFWIFCLKFWQRKHLWNMTPLGSYYRVHNTKFSQPLIDRKFARNLKSVTFFSKFRNLTKWRLKLSHFHLKIWHWLGFHWLGFHWLVFVKVNFLDVRKKKFYYCKNKMKTRLIFVKINFL